MCDNVCEHMLGSVFAKFRSENDAMKAMEGMHGRFYAGEEAFLPQVMCCLGALGEW